MIGSAVPYMVGGELDRGYRCTAALRGGAINTGLVVIKLGAGTQGIVRQDVKKVPVSGRAYQRQTRREIGAHDPKPLRVYFAYRKDGMNRIFVDMDGVIVDFDAYKTAHGMTGEEVKRQPGAYLEMPAIPGALSAVRSLIGMGFEVWIATKPPTGVPYAYSDKAAWVIRELPELKRRIIITHDKGLLGDSGDYLCDDRPHKANCEKFAGTLLRFVDGYHWPQALEFFRREARIRRQVEGDPT